MRLLANVALLTASVAISLALAELVVRTFDVTPRFQVIFRELVQPSDNPVLGYELRPGAPDGRRFKISSTGLRDGEYPLEKPEGVFRIAAIGDSVTYGLASPRDGSWVESLESMLNHRRASGGPRFEVLNFGVSGYHIGQVVERLRVHGLPHEPDLILYGYTLNDPQEFSIEAGALEDLRDASEGRFRRPFRGVILRRWLGRSQVFLLARHVLTDSGSANAGAPGLRRDPIMTAFQESAVGEYIRALHAEGESRGLLERGMEDLARISGDAGVPVVVAVFPLFLDDDSGDYPVADVHALVGDEARRRGFVVVDLQEPMAAASREADRPIHHDFLHPNVLGNRAAARALLEGLCDREVLPDAVRCPDASKVRAPPSAAGEARSPTTEETPE